MMGYLPAFISRLVHRHPTTFYHYFSWIFNHRHSEIWYSLYTIAYRRQYQYMFCVLLEMSWK